MTRPLLCGVLAASLLASPLAAADGKPISGPKKPVELWNGKDLEGWTVVSDPGKDATGTWAVKDGAITCTGKPRGYLRTDKAYKNYRLRLQWRWSDKPGNSGVFLHGGEADKVWPHCYEAQLQATNAGELRVNGGSKFHKDSKPEEKSLPKAAESSEKPPGEWNEYDIVCKGRTITLFVNGVRQNRLEHATLDAGWIGLQSEGGAIEFRNITVEKP
jgi:hypothetical protein